VFGGYPGHRRILIGPSGIELSFYTRMVRVRTVTHPKINTLPQQEFRPDTRCGFPFAPFDPTSG